jgi:hypothetical protein
MKILLLSRYFHGLELWKSDYSMPFTHADSPERDILEKLYLVHPIIALIIHKTFSFGILCTEHGFNLTCGPRALHVFKEIKLQMPP